jgi:hypothetical protein
MEPHRDHPTIQGEIIYSALSEVLQRNSNQRIMMIIAMIISGTLFIYSPQLAPIIQPLFTWINPLMTVGYIQGALERTYSAFLVTFIVTFFTFAIQVFQLRKQKPIIWELDLEGKKI